MDFLPNRTILLNVGKTAVFDIAVVDIVERLNIERLNNLDASFAIFTSVKISGAN